MDIKGKVHFQYLASREKKLILTKRRQIQNAILVEMSKIGKPVETETNAVVIAAS